MEHKFIIITALLLGPLTALHAAEASPILTVPVRVYLVRSEMQPKLRPNLGQCLVDDPGAAVSVRHVRGRACVELVGLGGVGLVASCRRHIRSLAPSFFLSLSDSSLRHPPSA